MTSECWSVDPVATATASRMFPGHQPIVMKTKGQTLIEHTPQGTIELFDLDDERILAAAERLPQHAKQLEPNALPANVVDHLNRSGLRPWKMLRRRPGFAEQLVDLIAGDEDPLPAGEEFLWPYTSKLPETKVLLGESRQVTYRQLQATLVARGAGDPLPLLWGPKGLGKHTMTANLARDARAAGIDVSFGRLLIERILQTPSESFLDFILELQNQAGQAVLAFSSAEWLANLPILHRLQVMGELSQLDRVVLITEHDLRPLLAERCVTLPCPGLARQDCFALLSAECPQLTVAEAALEMMAQAAHVPGFGVIPARLLLLARLASSLACENGTTTTVIIRPDDVAPAVALVQNSATQTCIESQDTSGAPSDQE